MLKSQKNDTRVVQISRKIEKEHSEDNAFNRIKMLVWHMESAVQIAGQCHENTNHLSEVAFLKVVNALENATELVKEQITKMVELEIEKQSGLRNSSEN